MSQVTPATGVPRSSRVEVRNPIMGLAAFERMGDLPLEARTLLIELLTEMRNESRAKAELCWRTHKAPMAVYYKATAVHLNHIQRALKKSASRRVAAPAVEPSRVVA